METAMIGSDSNRRYRNMSMVNRPINVAEAERVACTIGGAALAVYGLSRGSLGGLILAGLGSGLICRGVTGHCAVYESMGISTADHHGPATSVEAGAGVKVEKSFTIQRSPEELYRFWRNLENLPRFMHHLQSVQTHGNRSHWVAKAPMGATVEWDAEIINERPNELIAWRSLEGSEVDTAGSVHFEPARSGRGTEVKIVLKYDPPAGKAGVAIAKVLGRDAEQEIEEDLRRFKEVVESGQATAWARQLAGR
ncbi:MAG: SRPBCC family protein [Gemmataceae bacterium]